MRRLGATLLGCSASIGTLPRGIVPPPQDPAEATAMDHAVPSLGFDAKDRVGGR